MSIDIDSICKGFCIMLNNEPINIFCFLFFLFIGSLFYIMQKPLKIESKSILISIMFHNVP